MLLILIHERFDGTQAQLRRDTLELTFRKVNPMREMTALRTFDRNVFPKADLFTANEWHDYISYWMILDKKMVGCCAFLHGVDFKEDVRKGGNVLREGSLYISSTVILPKFQGVGLGGLFKAWQLAYAKYHGFNRIVTNMRKANRRIIALNKRFGFQMTRETPRYYSGPVDSTVVMALKVD